MDLPALVTIDEIDFSQIDPVLLCAAAIKPAKEVIANLPKDLKIVDLSGRFPAARS